MIKKFLQFGTLVTATLLLVSLQTVSAAIDPGLELHWNLDEGSGSVANDDSGHGNVGTLYNGPTYVPGHNGLAVSLDGIDQYVQVDAPLSSLGTADQPYALSAWVNVAPGVTQGNIIHISSNADGSGWCIPFLRLEGGVFTATGWDTANGSESAVGTTQPTAGQWYQVLTSWDPVNGLRLFVNGTLEASTPQVDYAAAGTPIYVSAGMGSGACSDDQGYFNGLIDDVRIYSRVLTSADIQSISTEGDTPVVTPTANAPVASAPTLTNTGVDISVASFVSSAIIVTASFVRSRRKYSSSTVKL